MNSNTTDREMLSELAGRLTAVRITPDEGSNFLKVAMIRAALRRFHGNQVRTAMWFGVHRNCLARWIAHHQIDLREFKPVGRRSQRKPVRRVPPWCAKREKTA